MLDLILISKLTIFSLFMAFSIAQLEINIEGKDGWAKNLPTWKIKNKWTKIIYGEYPLTGYHLYLIMTVLGFLHFPFFFGLDWSLSKEFIVLALYCIILLIEDFFWFIFNPHYGFKKFHKHHIVWHHHWIFNVPVMYFKFVLSAVIFLILSILTLSQ